MKKINSISGLLGFILLAKKDESALSILVFISTCRVLNWITTIQELYFSFLSLLQNISHFLFSNWEAWRGGKNANANATAPSSTSREHVENGTKSCEDLGRIMGKLGILWDKNGEENQDSLDLGEISTLFDETEPSVEEVKEAFDLFDENKDGFIDAKELEKMLHKLGCKETSESECQRMILAFDSNRDRRIDFWEFFRIVEDSLR